MDSDVSGLAETDENILTLDVPDDALERAAGGTRGRSRLTFTALMLGISAA